MMVMFPISAVLLLLVVFLCWSSTGLTFVCNFFTCNLQKSLQPNLWRSRACKIVNKIWYFKITVEPMFYWFDTSTEHKISSQIRLYLCILLFELSFIWWYSVKHKLIASLFIYQSWSIKWLPLASRVGNVSSIFVCSFCMNFSFV